MNFLKQCRLCRCSLDNVTTINLFQANKIQLLQQIKAITGVLLLKSEKLPQNICDRCKLDLDHAYQFRERCVKSDEYFSENLHIETEVIVHDMIDRNQLVQTNDVNEKSKQTSAKTEYLLLKTEPTDNAIDTPDWSDNDNPLDENCHVVEVAAKPQNNLNRRKKCIKPLAKHNIQSKRCKDNQMKLKEFICDQCGNHFKSRNHFTTHLRRHTGDKGFQCELCPDKFFTHSELNRHMRRHTGERPFACKHCDRRFTDYSTRIKHERTHTNERPFSCKQCNKSFTTSYILKNHMLTHTGERSFKCNFCNRTFQRQTHLDVHYRSIMHKQNAEKSQIDITASIDVRPKS